MEEKLDLQDICKEETAMALTETAETEVFAEPEILLPASAVLPQEEISENKRVKVFGVELGYLCFLGIIMGFIGWIAENLVRAVSVGVIDSRFHVLPFIPIYGLVVFAVQILFGDPNDLTVFGKKVFKTQSKKNKVFSNILCLLIMYAAVFFGELIVGNAWEAVSGAEMWNYNSLPLHVTQYAGLIPTVGYGTGAYLLAKFCFCPAIRFLQKKANYKITVIFSYVLGFLMVADELAMILQILILGQPPVYWQIFIW